MFGKKPFFDKKMCQDIKTGVTVTAASVAAQLILGWAICGISIAVEHYRDSKKAKAAEAAKATPAAEPKTEPKAGNE